MILPNLDVSHFKTSFCFVVDTHITLLYYWNGSVSKVKLWCSDMLMEHETYFCKRLFPLVMQLSHVLPGISRPKGKNLSVMV